MDLRMPVVDGFEAARRIRRLPHPYGATPIVAVTADTGPQVEPNVLAAGMNACLFKPIDIARLTESVAAWAGAGPLLPRDARSARRGDRGPSAAGA
jgi:CheY-like chemotaxis protein